MMPFRRLVFGLFSQTHLPLLSFSTIVLWSSNAVHASLRGSQVLPRAVSERSYTRISGYDCFRNIEGMTDTMFDLEKNYPDLVSVKSIGRSSSQVDINVMKITAKGSQSSSKGIVLLTSGVHAREYAPPELLMRFAEDLLKMYNKDADKTWIMEHTEIHIIFYVNPDGRLKAEDEPDTMWRKNTNPGTYNKCSNYEYGVDINRNFDFQWGDSNGASKNPCDDTYMGTSAASETETLALTKYAKSLFPESQRKSDPVGQMNKPFGENITGLYMDIHAFGGFTYYPWGHKNYKSPDNESLEALGRKISSFNGYDLWAGGQPGFQYPVSGDTSDYMYAVLGVASFGMEIGQAFYESCSLFENEILQSNLPALLYAAKVSKMPNALPKGPDILKLVADTVGSKVTVTASASDSKLVNIMGYPKFGTGDQTVSGISLSLDVHPDDVKGGNAVVEMTRNGNEFEGIISLQGISSGKHILYAQARDSDGYLGPVSSIFVAVDGYPASPSVASPSPTPASGGGTEQWKPIVNEHFNSGYGVFVKRGADVRHFTRAKRRDGVVRIRSGSLSTKFRASSYSHFNVEFSAMFLMGKSDKLCFDYRSKGAWKQVRCWIGEKFHLKSWYNNLSTKFDAKASNIAVRFRYTGDVKNVFIDRVLIQGKS